MELIAHEDEHEVAILGLFIDPDLPILKLRLHDYHNSRNLLSPAEAIELIKESLGLPILANPVKSLNGKCLNVKTLREQINVYKEIGLLGVEVYRPEYDAGTTSLLRRVTLDLGLVCSGGSDFHAPEDPEHQLGNIDMPSDVWEKLRRAAIEQDEHSGKTVS